MTKTKYLNNGKIFMHQLNNFNFGMNEECLKFAMKTFIMIPFRKLIKLLNLMLK